MMEKTFALESLGKKNVYIRLLQHKIDFNRDTCDTPLNSHRPVGDNSEVEGTQTALRGMDAHMHSRLEASLVPVR
jgi:hypothetical protein